jgi:hypothetical protein
MRDLAGRNEKSLRRTVAPSGGGVSGQRMSRIPMTIAREAFDARGERPPLSASAACPRSP